MTNYTNYTMLDVLVPPEEESRWRSEQETNAGTVYESPANEEFFNSLHDVVVGIVILLFMAAVVSVAVFAAKSGKKNNTDGETA